MCVDPSAIFRPMFVDGFVAVGHKPEIFMSMPKEWTNHNCLVILIAFLNECFSLKLGSLWDCQRENITPFPM